MTAESDSDDSISTALLSTQVPRVANSLLLKGETVPVRLTSEPGNPINSKAIALECEIDGQWGRIGYFLNEVLEDVHKAINNKEITGVSFKWIKFITDWYKSGRRYILWTS